MQAPTKGQDQADAREVNRAQASGRPAGCYLTLVEVFELTAPVEEYRAAITALAQRSERESTQGLVGYEFYLDPGSGEGGAIVRFVDSTAFEDHMRRISAWDEFHRFMRTARLTDMRIYGVLGAQGEAWMAESSFGASKTFPNHVAGFVRS